MSTTPANELNLHTEWLSKLCGLPDFRDNGEGQTTIFNSPDAA